MEAAKRIEQSLGTILAQASTPECPPRLMAAVRHAVFPAGARVRPRLCLAVARACGEDDPPATDAAAAAVELLHCASLVHDDLPCFDDAAMRRGQPSVHAAFGAMPGRARRRRADRACLPDARGRRCAASVAAAGLAQHHGPRGRHAGRHRGGAGLGMRNQRGAVRLPASQDRCACLPRPRRPAPPRRGTIPQHGARSANGWARPTRSPTISATSSGAVTRSASRAGATPPWAAQVPCTNWRAAGALKRLRYLIASSIEAIPPCDGTDDLRH